MNNLILTTTRYTQEDQVGVFNNTHYSSNVIDFHKTSQWSTIIRWTATLLMAVCSTFGNSLTLACIRKTPNLWTKTNKLLAHLAVSELLIAASTVSSFAYSIVTAANNIACELIVLDTILKSLRRLPPRVGVNFLLLVGIDRYVAIVHPYAYEVKLTDRVLNWMCVGAWVSAILLAVFESLWAMNANQLPCTGVPQVVPNLYLFVTISGEYFAVSVFLAVVYSKILRIAWRQSMLVGCTIPQPAVSRTDNGASVADETHIQHERIMKTKQRNRQLKAAFLTSAMVGAFVVLWFPYALYFLLMVVYSSSDALNNFQQISTGIALFNFSFNWIIYVAISKSYQRAYKQLLCSCNKQKI